MSKEKVGIITYHFARNYGAVLQCYALRKYLEKVGYDATVLNAISRVQEKNNSVFHKKDGIKNVIVNVILLPFVKQRSGRKGFCRFCRKLYSTYRKSCKCRAAKGIGGSGTVSSHYYRK